MKSFHAVVLHHFNDHMHCNSSEEGGWCCYKCDAEKQREGKESNRFRNKEKMKDLYENIAAILDKFGTKEMLLQLYHFLPVKKANHVTSR